MNIKNISKQKLSLQVLSLRGPFFKYTGDGSPKSSLSARTGFPAIKSLFLPFFPIGNSYETEVAGY